MHNNTVKMGRNTFFYVMTRISNHKTCWCALRLRKGVLHFHGMIMHKHCHKNSIKKGEGKASIDKRYIFLICKTFLCLGENG